MDHFITTASTVTAQLFGPDSGVPGWAWILVLVALFWKVLIPEPKTVRELGAERDDLMVSAMFEDANGKKGKKKK